MLLRQINKLRLPIGGPWRPFSTTIGPIFSPHSIYTIPETPHLAGYADVLTLPEVSALLKPSTPLHLDLSALARCADIFRSMPTHYPSALHLLMKAHEYVGQYSKSAEFADELQAILSSSSSLLMDLTVHKSRMHILAGDFKSVEVGSALTRCEAEDDLNGIASLLHLQGLAGSLSCVAEEVGDADEHLADMQTATRNSDDPKIFNNYALMTYLLRGPSEANDVVEMLEENYDDISINADRASCQANIATILLKSWSALPEGDKRRVTLLKDASDSSSTAIEMIDADDSPYGCLKGRVLTVLGETYSAVGDGLTAEGLYSSSSDAFFNLESQAQTILSRIHLSKVEIKLYASWERREGDIARIENRIEADTEKLGLGWRQILKDDDVEEKVKILSGLNI